MLFILTTAGQALIDASPGVPVACTSFRLAQTTPYIPTIGQTAPVGSMLFSGIPGAAEEQANGSVKYPMFLDSTVGNFDFNEVALFVGTTLFAIACASTSITKTKTTSFVQGNNLSISAYITSGSSSGTIGLANSAQEYNVADVASPDLLPQAASSDINIYNVGIGSAGELTLAHKMSSRWELSGFASSGPLIVSAGGANFVQFATRQRIVDGAGMMLVQAISGPNAGFIRTVSSYVDTNIRYNLSNAFPTPIAANDTVEILWYNKIDDVSPVFGTGAPTGSTSKQSGYYVDTSGAYPVEYAYRRATNAWVRLGKPDAIESGLYRNRVALVGYHNYRTRLDSNKSSINQDSVFAWANAGLKDALTVTGVFGDLATVTIDDIVNTHIPAALAADCDYVDVNLSFTDIYTNAATASAVLAKIVLAVDSIIAAAKIPVINTLAAREFSTEAILTEHLKLNAGIRSFLKTKSHSIMFDAFRVSCDVESSTCLPYTGFATAGVFSVLGASYIGQAKAKVLGKFVRPAEPSFVSAGETYGRVGNYNVVLNSAFTGTAGTTGANVSGTVPTDWRVEWATRVGTGVAQVRVEEVTDEETGLVVANGIAVSISSGIPANGDVLRIVQNSATLASRIQGGTYIKTEAGIKLYAVAGIRAVGLATTVNTNVSSWGSAGAASADYEGQHDIKVSTLPTLVSGAGAATTASIDVNVTFSGNDPSSNVVVHSVKASLEVSNPFINA